MIKISFLYKVVIYYEFLFYANATRCHALNNVHMKKENKTNFPMGISPRFSMQTRAATVIIYNTNHVLFSYPLLSIIYKGYHNFH